LVNARAMIFLGNQDYSDFLKNSGSFFITYPLFWWGL